MAVKIKKFRRPTQDLEMSSISDIVFLLLIYFMVVTVFQQDIGMPFVLLAAADNQDPEAALAALRARMAEVQRELEEEAERRDAAQSALRGLETDIGRAAADLSTTRSELAAGRERRRALLAQKSAREATLAEERDLLARQIRAAYLGGRQERLRLALNQQDPARLGRMLAYYDYVNRAQVERVAGLREALARLEALQAPVDAEIERIAELQAEQQAVLEELERQRADRLALVQAMSLEIGDRESALTELERNRRDLQELIDRLADILADIPEDLENEAGVAARKGRLPMPVSGPVRHAFGQDRGAGLDWQGWLIGAEAGTEVRSVAHGRVAFADWLRGYGMLLVIDHGDGFMTLYGHNESLLHEAGEWVNGGDVISTVGSNPGGTQGAYFEIRRDGKALDPSAWLAR